MKYRTANLTEEGFARLVKLRNLLSEQTGENISLIKAAEQAINEALLKALRDQLGDTKIEAVKIYVAEFGEKPDTLPEGSKVEGDDL